MRIHWDRVAPRLPNASVLPVSEVLDPVSWSFAFKAAVSHLLKFKVTFRPLGPSVTLTALASLLTPRRMASRAS